MVDKILILKKELFNIAKSGKMTSMERYNLIHKKCQELEKDEFYLLKKEFEKEYEINQHTEELSIIYNLGIPGIMLIISTASLYFNSTGNSMNAENYNGLLLTILGFLIVSMLMCTFRNVHKKRANIYIKFVLDSLKKKR